MKPKVLFTAEAVGQGHPDKICDQIADRILDACLAKDAHAHVACEVLVTTNRVILAGEVKSAAPLTASDYEAIARQTIADIGYTDADSGIDPQTMIVENLIKEQSPDIDRGIEKNRDPLDMGAGDQGMMFGYATNETENYLPLAYALAREIVQTADQMRHAGKLPHARPDMKAEVTIDQTDPQEPAINAVVFSCQHDQNVELETFRAELQEQVLRPLVENFRRRQAGNGFTAGLLKLPAASEIYINPTGRFVIGGPLGDTGLTGRKIIADTYGGAAPHGGGAFSGKDPSKVDRSGAYMARYVARNIVAAGLADKCLVQVAYAIGVAKPVSINIDTYHTNKVPTEKILLAVLNNEELFDFRPRGIIDKFGLLKPNFKYGDLACYGHFGRTDLTLPWEKEDAIAYLKQACLA